MAKYILTKQIQIPGFTVSVGTKAIPVEDYLVFPYDGHKYNDGGTGWLGEGFWLHKSQLQLYPEWVREEK